MRGTEVRQYGQEENEQREVEMRLETGRKATRPEYRSQENRLRGDKKKIQESERN